MAQRKSWTPWALAACAALALAGCGMTPTATRGNAGSMSVFGKSSGDIQLYALPATGTNPVLAAINGAKKSIQLEIYMFTNHDISAEVLQALIARSKAGVDVRVIIEAHPYIPPTIPAPGQAPVASVNPNVETTQALLAGGVKVKRSSPKFRYTHEKAMLIDQQTAYVMTSNFTNSGLAGNREYVVASKDPADAKELGSIFAADWDETVHVTQNPNFVVSPENSRAKLLTLIDSAKSSLTMQCEFATDPAIVQHLGARAKAGVDVKIMLAQYDPDPVTGNDTNAQESQLLTAAGVTQFKFTRTIKVHAKAILVDGKQAFVGSENMTTNSLDGNREVGMLLTDGTALSILGQTMAKDWSAN